MNHPTIKYRSMTIRLFEEDLTLPTMAKVWWNLFNLLPTDGTWKNEDELIQNILWAIQDIAIEIHGYSLTSYLIDKFGIENSILAEYIDSNLQGK